MNEKEKIDLRERIITSASAYKTKTRGIRTKRIYYSLSVAASVIIILAIGVYKYDNLQTPIIKYVESSKAVGLEKANDVQLIINGNKKLLVERNNSSINYASNGSGINIVDSLGGGQEIAVDEPNKFNTLIVPYGQRSKIVLSDGTKVWLNSGSKLIYPAAFNGKNREVFLMGEAIFDVAHDVKHPFKVLSEGQTVEVLGTIFNVSSYPDENTVRTVLQSGSVKISYKSDSFFKTQESTKITPGTMAVYNKKTPGIETKNVNVKNHFSWREGLLVFQNNSLKHIMKKLDRYYNVSIIFKELELEDETFSGYLDLKGSIDDVLKTLQDASGFEYNDNENGSILINKIEYME